MSYEIYLFHLVVLGGLRTVWAPNSETTDVKLLILVGYLGLSVMVAALVSRIYSEPLNRRLRAGRTVPAALAEA